MKKEQEKQKDQGLAVGLKNTRAIAANSIALGDGAIATKPYQLAVSYVDNGKIRQMTKIMRPKEAFMMNRIVKSLMLENKKND